MNSLTLLLAFLVFIAFGYISLGRILYKKFFNTEVDQTIVYDKAIPLSILTQLSQGSLFYSIPAISIALYWGWIPALIWLVVSHIFADFLFNAQLSFTPSHHQQSEPSLGIKFYQTAGQSKALSSLIIKLLLQCYILLVATISLTYTVKLMDVNSGVLFLLIMLIPAQLVFTKKNSHRITMSIISLLLLWLGITLGQHIGLAFHGGWTPFAKTLPWLSVNNATLNACIIAIMAYLLSSRSSFRRNLSYLSGGIILLLLLIFLINIIWLRPILDAPLQNQANTGLPWFITVCVFLLSGSIGTVLRLFTPHERTKKRLTTNNLITDNLSSGTPLNHRGQFLCYQSGSLISLLFWVCLFSIMAAAVGIGAWDTHFLNWSGQQSLVSHWLLLLDSIQSLIAPDGDGFSRTAIISMLACLGLCSVVFALSIQKQLTDNENTKNALYQSIAHSPAGRITTFCIVSLLLIHYGIPFSLWLLFGCLSWLLLCLYTCSTTAASNTDQSSYLVFSILSLVLVFLGLAQLVLLTAYWFKIQQNLLTSLSLSTLALSILLLYKDCLKIIQSLFKNKDEKLFQDDT